MQKAMMERILIRKSLTVIGLMIKVAGIRRVINIGKNSPQPLMVCVEAMASIMQFRRRIVLMFSRILSSSCLLPVVLWTRAPVSVV